MPRVDLIGDTSKLLSDLRIDEVDYDNNQRLDDAETVRAGNAATNPCGALHAQPIPPQHQSPLRSLPNELRLRICSYIELSLGTFQNQRRRRGGGGVRTF